MRYPIWKKEDFFSFVNGPRIDMDPAVVVIPEECVLGWNYDLARDPIGKVTDIRLEDGEITGEVTFFDSNEKYEQFLTPEKEGFEALCRLGGYYTDVKKLGTAKNQRVTSCDLRAVFMMMMDHTPGWKPSSV